MFTSASLWAISRTKAGGGRREKEGGGGKRGGAGLEVQRRGWAAGGRTDRGWDGLAGNVEPAIKANRTALRSGGFDRLRRTRGCRGGLSNSQFRSLHNTLR